MAAVARVNWATLPIEKRNELIEYRWAEVGGPEWLPVLEQIVAGPANPGRAMNKPNRETALLRIRQVAPEEAQPLILQEIAKPQGDIGISVLGQLPEHTLPQFEAWGLSRSGRAARRTWSFNSSIATERAYIATLQSIYEARRGEWACSRRRRCCATFCASNPIMAWRS